VFAWGLWKQDIHIDNIVEPGYTLCFAAKWHGEKEMIYKSVHHDGDEVMIQTAYDLINQADAVVHYNGTKFDMPILNQEFLAYGLDPPSPVHQIDLLKTAKRQFRLPSNKLDYVARFLGLQGKIKHKGMQLWLECMEGNESAWNTMRRYNIQDVRLLERVYKTLMPWIKDHPNMGLYNQKDRPVCTNCGSHHLQRRGQERTKTQVYQRFQCTDCGKWQRGRLNDTPQQQKANTLVSI
jgi:RNase P subunit RPR2